MAHEAQARYSSLVDAKLRDSLVKKDGVVFNTRYEGNPNDIEIALRKAYEEIQRRME